MKYFFGLFILTLTIAQSSYGFDCTDARALNPLDPNQAEMLQVLHEATDPTSDIINECLENQGDYELTCGCLSENSISLETKQIQAGMSEYIKNLELIRMQNELSLLNETIDSMPLAFDIPRGCMEYISPDSNFHKTSCTEENLNAFLPQGQKAHDQSILDMFSAADLRRKIDDHDSKGIELNSPTGESAYHAIMISLHAGLENSSSPDDFFYGLERYLNSPEISESVFYNYIEADPSAELNEAQAQLKVYYNYYLSILRTPYIAQGLARYLLENFRDNTTDQILQGENLSNALVNFITKDSDRSPSLLTLINQNKERIENNCVSLTDIIKRMCEDGPSSSLKGDVVDVFTLGSFLAPNDVSQVLQCTVLNNLETSVPQFQNLPPNSLGYALQDFQYGDNIYSSISRDGRYIIPLQSLLGTEYQMPADASFFDYTVSNHLLQRHGTIESDAPLPPDQLSAIRRLNERSRQNLSVQRASRNLNTDVISGAPLPRTEMGPPSREDIAARNLQQEQQTPIIAGGNNAVTREAMNALRQRVPRLGRSPFAQSSLFNNRSNLDQVLSAMRHEESDLSTNIQSTRGQRDSMRGLRSRTPGPTNVSNVTTTSTPPPIGQYSYSQNFYSNRSTPIKTVPNKAVPKAPEATSNMGRAREARGQYQDIIQRYEDRIKRNEEDLREARRRGDEQARERSEELLNQLRAEVQELKASKERLETEMKRTQAKEVVTADKSESAPQQASIRSYAPTNIGATSRLSSPATVESADVTASPSSGHTARPLGGGASAAQSAANIVTSSGGQIGPSASVSNPILLTALGRQDSSLSLKLSGAEFDSLDKNALRSYLQQSNTNLIEVSRETILPNGDLVVVTEMYQATIVGNTVEYQLMSQKDDAQIPGRAPASVTGVDQELLEESERDITRYRSLLNLLEGGVKQN